LRRDAAQNRTRLIDAARTIMRDEGGDVALETIAERAGISRGTVYRNFEDRQQLYEAVLDDELERIRDSLRCPERSADLPEVMRLLVELMAVYDRFRAALPHLPEFQGERCRHEAMLALLIGPMERSKAAGFLKDSVTAEELLLACRMVAAGWPLDLEPDKQTALDKRLRLILRGIGTDKCLSGQG
jgi:AcrR family transcriptional regulator